MLVQHWSLTLLLAGLVSVVPFSAVAQDSGSSNPQSAPAGAPEHGRGHGNFDPQKRTERLTKELNLTSDQQSKVLDIFKSEQSQMEKLRSDSSTPQEDRRSKMMEIRKTSADQVRGILDADQQKKFDTARVSAASVGDHARSAREPGRILLSRNSLEKRFTDRILNERSDGLPHLTSRWRDAGFPKSRPGTGSPASQAVPSTRTIAVCALAQTMGVAIQDFRSPDGSSRQTLLEPSRSLASL